jgi:flagellar basal-body rod protein FlgC
MDFIDSLKTSATGLSAQRLRMNLIASNLANVNTPRSKDGAIYQRKDAVFSTRSTPSSFGETLSKHMGEGLAGVEVVAIKDDNRPPILKLDPNHPDADEDGFVALPNINVVEEMVNMITATRSYEANVAAVKATKEMASSALEIGR